jgi:Na+-translocating ferredoxin:NAD+ oxidoreductase RnfE subunit
MTLGYTYPLLGAFWTMMMFFILIIWIMVLFHVFADIFRSHDMGGFAKALWLIFVIFVPLIGVAVYLIARGDNMAQHGMERAQARDNADVQRYFTQQAAGTNAPADPHG